ncbi:hypothetical protein DCM91_08855 [Chitinophaga costaii]|nr:hypothetical protein DCM91_08855 [Chitinophaga costaii]
MGGLQRLAQTCHIMLPGGAPVDYLAVELSYNHSLGIAILIKTVHGQTNHYPDKPDWCAEPMFYLVRAYVVQFAWHEFPCPLYLLQRKCVMGVAFGLMLNLRNGIKSKH